MIVYLASYPRSGNFWLQTLLGNQFKRLTTNIHVERKETDKTKWAFDKTFKRWYDIDVFRTPTVREKEYPQKILEWLAWYEASGIEGEQPFLIPGCKEIVKSKSIRSFLAAEEEVFFLKTHYPPYKNYFPGEYVIQVVRNPGATVWSFYNFKKNVKPQEGITLSAEINGDPFYGSWSDYHKEWISIAQKLNDNYLLIKYENIKDKELDICEKIQTFLDLPIISTELRSFDYYHKMRPSLTRQGKSVGWEGHFSKRQLELLWRVHSNLMIYYGYEKPQLNLAVDRELY